MAKPKQFDRTEVLERAMRLFWEKGYAATSVEDLVAATGINRGSMYDTFGDKRQLFLAAVDHYMATVSATRTAILREPGSPSHALRRFFNDLVAFSHGDDRRLGCLLTNAAIEMAPHDPAVDERLSTAFSRLENCFYDTLFRAQKDGEIAMGRDLRAAARLLLCTVEGIRVLARAKAEEDTLRDIADNALSAVL